MHSTDFSPDDWTPDETQATDRNSLDTRKSLSYWADVWRRFKQNKLSLFGLAILVLLIATAVFGPSLTKLSDSDQNLAFIHIPPLMNLYSLGGDTFVYLSPSMQVFEVSPKGRMLGLVPQIEDDMFSKRRVYELRGARIVVDYRKKPVALSDGSGTQLSVTRKNVWNRTYWFGTDAVGRDIFVRIVYGARISMIIGFVASLMNLTLGIFYGGISGYLGGMADNTMMRIIDILRSIPRLLYVILLMVVFGSGLLTVVIVIGLVDWLGMARIVRGQVLSIKHQEYVLAARALGANSRRILTRHLIPNAMGPIIVQTTMNIPAAIFTEAFLSFVGLGVSAPQASWGTLANNALSGFMSYPYEMFFPAAAICLTVLAFNFLGDGLRDAIDPRLRD